MHQPFHYTIHQQNFLLSAERCVFWEEEKALIIADLHFGKTGHFRKAGIGIPQNIYKEDLQRLLSLVQHFNPNQLIVVGDMFHSAENKELELFRKWRDDFQNLHIHLVKGNHDILKASWYKLSNIEIHNECFSIKNISFVHDCEQVTPIEGSDYHFCGHLHPGFCISGAGRQTLKFPCFYFTKKYAVLPAFSRFTGIALVDPGEEETVFAIVEKSVIPMYGYDTVKNC